MAEKIKVLIDAGKATAGPPIGPALGALGMNIMEIVKVINERTKEFEGMKIPVEITVEPKTKSFDIAVGTPPTSGLILKELGLEKGSGHSQKTKVGDLTMEQVINIVKKKHAGLLGSNLRKAANEVLGTCMSMGVTVDGKHAKEVQKLINEGGYKELFD